eukprot:g135.t1
MSVYFCVPGTKSTITIAGADAKYRMSKKELIELVEAFEYFSELKIQDLDALNALRLLRDGLENVISHLKLTEKEKEALLCTGTLQDARVYSLFRTQSEVKGSRTYVDVERLWGVLSKKSINKGIKDGLRKSTIRYFLHIQNTFIVTELEKLENEANERASKATRTAEKTVWTEQADQFGDMKSMNDDDEIDEDNLDRVFALLKLTSDDSCVSKSAFLDFFSKNVLSRLPLCFFMDKLKLKQSRNFNAQMSLRFNSSKSFLS